MRFSVLLLLTMAACPAGLEAEPFHWPWSDRTIQPSSEKPTPRRFRLPWNSRTTEQTKLNAALAPKPTSREEEIMRPDITKEFNPSAANFGSGRSLNGKSASTSTFHFVNRTQTKSFETKGISTKSAMGIDTQFATKSALTKESWFARRTASAKAYDTKANTDANKGLLGGTLPNSDKKFVARGRRQAELDKNGAASVPFGVDRDSGQSWSGEVRPLSIQDVKTLLNKN